ncbi:MAG: hypothetical protein ACQRW7_06755 [Caulobacterales bacterium]|uniref:hypothetical protein n=1 Tax=Glycocaulis sp. TaxID=1969725 RepID=UPI003FA04341
MAMSAWWNDFHYANGTMHVKKTGAAVRIEPAIVQDFLNWCVFHGWVEFARRSVISDGPRVWFTPDTPRPWYLIWPVMALSRARMARSAAEADLIFVFDDSTWVDERAFPAGVPVINGRCNDISKTHVARVFEQVTGRALACDPMNPGGPYVEKSEQNAAHDGRILTTPQARREGYTYQRLINNIDEDGLALDLRCSTIGGEIVQVYLKRRPADRRFANCNCDVTLTDPAAVFSAVERAMISRFCAAMGLDWGGIDVLRDRDTGELWIVDVNKTDMGPTIALNMSGKIKAVRRLAARLDGYLDTRLQDQLSIAA